MHPEGNAVLGVDEGTPVPTDNISTPILFASLPDVHGSGRPDVADPRRRIRFVRPPGHEEGGHRRTVHGGDIPEHGGAAGGTERHRPRVHHTGGARTTGGRFLCPRGDGVRKRTAPQHRHQ